MPLAKRSYAFKEDKEASKTCDVKNQHPGTPLSRIKTRGRSFMTKTPTREQAEEDLPFLSPFLRSSVRLKSFRKRKMASRENEVDGCYNKKVFVGDKCRDAIEEKIEENIRMRDGIMKLIQGCHDAKQAVDISKNLLTINSRVLSLMSSLQKKRSTSILKDHNKSQSKVGESSLNRQPCLAEVCISDIRIPLMWKADSHFKTKAGEPPTLLYHMFCLLKIGDQVYDTPLIQFDQIDTDVTFSHPYIFHNVEADFRLEVETYYTVMHNPDNPVWTPIRSQKKSVYDSAPKYCLAAHCQLTANDIKEGFLTSDFVMGSQGASITAVQGQVHDLPENPLALWGQFSCYLRAKPTCMLKNVVEGHIDIQTCNGGHPTWEKYFCRLRNCSIQGWKHLVSEDAALSMEPGMSIKIKGNMQLRVEKSPCGEKHVMILTSSDTEKEPVLSFESADDLRHWQLGLMQAIVDSQAWKIACDSPMKFEAAETKKNHFNKPFNFYDQVSADHSDVRPKSPRSVKKSKPYSLRITESASKRSFYDQIIVPDIIPEKEDFTTKANAAGSREANRGSVSKQTPLSSENEGIVNMAFEEKGADESTVGVIDGDDSLTMMDVAGSVAADVSTREEVPTEAMTSNEPVMTNGEEALTSDEQAVTSDEPILTSDEPILTSDEPILTSDEPILTSDEPILTSDEPILTSDKPKLTSDEPTVASNEQVMVSDEPAVVRGEPAVSSDELAVTSDEPVRTSDELAMTGDELASSVAENEEMESEQLSKVEMTVTGALDDQNQISAEATVVSNDESVVSNNASGVLNGLSSGELASKEETSLHTFSNVEMAEDESLTKIDNVSEDKSDSSLSGTISSKEESVPNDLSNGKITQDDPPKEAGIISKDASSSSLVGKVPPNEEITPDDLLSAKTVSDEKSDQNSASMTEPKSYSNSDAPLLISPKENTKSEDISEVERLLEGMSKVETAADLVSLVQMASVSTSNEEEAPESASDIVPEETLPVTNPLEETPEVEMPSENVALKAAEDASLTVTVPEEMPSESNKISSHENHMQDVLRIAADAINTSEMAQSVQKAVELGDIESGADESSLAYCNESEFVDDIHTGIESNSDASMPVAPSPIKATHEDDVVRENECETDICGSDDLSVRDRKSSEDSGLTNDAVSIDDILNNPDNDAGNSSSAVENVQSQEKLSELKDESLQAEDGHRDLVYSCIDDTHEKSDNKTELKDIETVLDVDINTNEAVSNEIANDLYEERYLETAVEVKESDSDFEQASVIVSKKLLSVEETGSTDKGNGICNQSNAEQITNVKDEENPNSASFSLESNGRDSAERENGDERGLEQTASNLHAKVHTDV